MGVMWYVFVDMGIVILCAHGACCDVGASVFAMLHFSWCNGSCIVTCWTLLGIIICDFFVFLPCRFNAMARRRGTRNKGGGDVKGRGIAKMKNVSCPTLMYMVCVFYIF